MKVLIEYWEAAVKLHTSDPSSSLVLLVGLMFVALAFEAEQPIASTIHILYALFILYLYIDVVRLEVCTQRHLRQKFIDSLDN